MKKEDKTKEQLINELVELRQRIAELEKVAAERKRAEEALRDSEGKYRVLFETAKDAVFLSDETGKFVDVNQVACESLGYSKEELLKLSNKEIDADPRGYEAFLKVRNGLLKEATFEVNQRRKDGIEATKEILEVDPEAKILFVSADDSVKEEALAAGACNFIFKTFKIDVLIEGIRIATR